MGETQSPCYGMEEHHGQDESHDQGGKKVACRGSPWDNPKRYPLSMGQRPAMMGQLLACSLKREKPSRKAKAGNWGCHGRVQAAEGEGQEKSLGGSLGHAWWIGPNSSKEGQG